MIALSRHCGYVDDTKRVVSTIHIAHIRVRGRPVCGDKVYDSTALRSALERFRLVLCFYRDIIYVSKTVRKAFKIFRVIPRIFRGSIQYNVYLGANAMP